MKKMEIDKWEALLIVGWYGCADSEGFADNLDKELADKIEKFKDKCFQEQYEKEKTEIK